MAPRAAVLVALVALAVRGARAVTLDPEVPVGQVVFPVLSARWESRPTVEMVAMVATALRLDPGPGLQAWVVSEVTVRPLAYRATMVL